MAHSKQSNKRIRQNERSRLHNKAIASVMRTEVKRVLALSAAGDKAGAEAVLPRAVKCVTRPRRPG